MCPNKPFRRITCAAIFVFLFFLTVIPAMSAAVPNQTDEVRIFVPESLTSISAEGSSLVGSRRGSMSVQSTTGKKIALVGMVGKGAKYDVEIINGNTHIKPVFHERYFHAQIILALGVNMIEVRWHKDAGQCSSKSISIFRASKIEGGVTGNYPPYTFHQVANEEHCQECHQMGLTKEEISTGMERSCLKCHVSLTENLFVHGPVSVGICTVCHDPDSTPNKYKVEENDNVLCYGCHEERRKIDESKKLQHGPVGAGMCTVCHDPHSSSFQYQLVKSKNEICAMCHQEDADRWMHLNSLHPPFKSGNCPGCHDPHSSDFKYNLKVDRKDLCALCHEIPVPGHLHEAGNVPRFKLPDDFPLTNDGKIMCLTCHDPHGAIGAKLTRRDGCDACHNK